MVMTNAEIARTLAVLAEVIAACRGRGPFEGESLKTLQTLERRERALRALLGVRRIEGAKRVVDLETWRSGHVPFGGRGRAAWVARGMAQG